MKIKGAMTVLRKQIDFLGHKSLEEALAWIEKNPMSNNRTTIQAYKVYAEYYERENSNKDDEVAVEHLKLFCESV